MVLEALFNGDLFPCDEICSIEKPEPKESQEVGRIMGVLHDKLSEEDFELIEKLSEHYMNRDMQLCEKAFQYGLALGMKLTQEADDVLAGYKLSLGK